MESKNKLLLVVNPISGGSEKEQLIKEITRILKDRNVVFETYKTTGKFDDLQIRKILDDENCNNVLVVGGDGTIQVVARAIQNRDVAISLIPAGSANGLSSNLQIPNAVIDQIGIALGENYLMMDMISINDHLCLHIADLGINAALIKNYQNSEIRGKLGYALQTIPTLLKADLPYKFHLNIEGQSIDAEGVMVAIANAKQFGTGAVINPKGKIDDGLFEVLIFKKLDILDILKTLDENSYRNPEFVECFSVKKVSIECQSPVSLQVDGEFIGDVKHVSAKLLPTKLKIMVPKQKPWR
jgi:diacylglycerol kinase (ATP)